MKNYYILKGGIACKETKNIFPQVLRPTPPKGSELFSKITNLKNRPNPHPKDLTIELELDPKTNPTDFISQSWIGSRGLLVSTKVFEFLSNFELQPEIEIYNTIIHHKKNKFDYVWINPTFDHQINIDFIKTKFFLFDFLEDKKWPIDIINEIDLIDKRLENNPIPTIITEELFVTKESILKLDLLFMSIGSTNIRISERLKLEIEKTKFSAFELSPALKFNN